MSYTLDVELFISEVKKYPEIWDLNSEDNRYKNRKQAAWAEIATVFIPDFEELPELEKIDVYKKLHGKWRNIRDSFVRHIKRKPGNKGYMYAKHLSFLNHLYKQIQTSDTEDLNWSDCEENTEVRRLAYKTRKIEVTNSNMWPSDDETPSTIENLKRKRVAKVENSIEYVDTPLTPDASCSYQTEDDDRSFFDSLLPAVREFNLDQKLEFRSEVICLIKKIRSGHKKIKLNSMTGEFDQ